MGEKRGRFHKKRGDKFRKMMDYKIRVYKKYCQFFNGDCLILMMPLVI